MSNVEQLKTKDRLDETSENLNMCFYGIDSKWIEIWKDVKHLDLDKMDWIDIIVLLGRQFNPPTIR